MQLLLTTTGRVCCLYGEAIELSALGVPNIRRASQVEPDEAGQWWADLAPVAGPKLGPFKLRSDALAAEAVWLESRLGELAGAGL